MSNEEEGVVEKPLNRQYDEEITPPPAIVDQ